MRYVNRYHFVMKPDPVDNFPQAVDNYRVLVISNWR